MSRRDNKQTGIIENKDVAYKVCKDTKEVSSNLLRRIRIRHHLNTGLPETQITDEVKGIRFTMARKTTTFMKNKF